MNNNIIMAKLQLPGFGKGIIDRTRLLAKVMDFREKRATFVVAPAGYGKTVFVKQFLDSVMMPFAWYRLDSFDNDPAQFVKYLTYGLSAAIPGFEAKVPENPEGIENGKKYYGIMASIVSELQSKPEKGLIIVFDDFHLIKEKEVLEFMEYFINYIPDTVHVIISSRYQPDLQLLNLKAGGNILEINQQDLRFNQAEASMLFRALDEQCLDDEFSGKLCNELNGWALGLKLFGLAFEGSMRDSADAAFLKARNEIFDYIFNELFTGLPDEIREFLLYTSVLEEMSPEACNYILDSEDAAEKLKYIERKNLFIAVTGSGRSVSYSYHHVFREFLLSILSDKKSGVLDKAGNYYLQNGAYEQAAEYFRLAGNDGMLLRTIEDAGHHMLQQGRLKTVEGWMDILEEKGLLEGPPLTMLKGELLSYSGHFDEAEGWIDRAISLFKENGNGDGMARAAIHKTRILRYRASFSESVKFIDEFLKAVPDFPAQHSLELSAEKVYSQWLTGNITGAIETAERALRNKEGLENKKAAERLFRYMAVLYGIRGNYSAALELYKQILVSCGGNEDVLEQGSIPLYISCGYREQGELAKALEMLQQSEARKKRLGFTEDMHLIYFNTAVTMLGYREFKEVEHYCGLAQEAFKNMGGKLSYYETMLQAFRSAITAYYGGKASTEAEALIEQAVLGLKDRSKYLLAYISPYFVLYYVKYGQYEKAAELLKLSISVSEAIGLKFQMSMLYGLKAAALYKCGDKEGALACAEQSVKLAAAEGYKRFFLIFPELLPCLEIALVNGIEWEFTEEIILRLDSWAVSLLLRLIKHPDSLVRGKALKLMKNISYRQMQQEIEVLFFEQDDLVRETAFNIIKEAAVSGEQTPKRLFVRCLGSFKVYLRTDWNNAVSWRTSKAKELFAYLLHWKGEPVASEKILADLWPDLDVDRARDLFHTNLTHVKSLLKHCGLEKNLQKHQSGYALDVKGIACDVWLPGASGCSGVYLEDIYSDWPYDRRLELENRYA